MMDDGLAIIAGEIGDFVTDSLAPLAEGLNEVSKRVDDLHQRPLPANGKDGAVGKDGEDGAKGDTGEKGADGVGVEASVYVPGVYREGSLVQAHFGQFYKALRDTSQGVDSDDWQRVGTSGFRICGGFEADRMYKSGDLFVKDFGLFLSDGEQNRLIAGRGAQGQKGKQGPAGKDGVDGQDGADGKDGSQIEALEINNTNLVAVFKSAQGDLETHSVDLSPILDATVEITKSFNEAKSADIAEAVNEQFKGLWATVQEHLSDKQATPIRFYRGLFSSSVSYQPGDLVNFSQSLYVAKRASYGILPFNQMARDINSGDYWAQILSGGGGGLGDIDLGEIDLTKYVKRPFIKDSWLVYKEGSDGSEAWAPVTTDLVAVNPNPFRNAKGQFIGTPEELDKLKSQRDVNEFLYNAINDIEQGDIDLEGYATEVQLGEVDAASIERDANLQDQIDAIEIPDGVDLTPVEDRLDDIEAVLPKVPEVIDPVEIGEQTLKITGNRPSGAGGEAGSVLMWKAEAGSGGSPYNECKLVVPDISVIDPDAASVWWKQGDKVQRWDMGGSGWFTSNNVLHYSAAETFGDTLVDGLPIQLFYTDPNATADDLIDTISRVESKADDRKLQVEIEELALALETLLVQREHGQWKYIGFTGDTIPRNAGEFGLLVSDIASSQENIITLNQEDLKGKTHGFGDTEVGDYVEIVNTADPSSYALFVITKAPEGTGIVNVEVALKDAGYNIWEGETCEIRFFAVNEQDLQLEDLDNRYVSKTAGDQTMKGPLEISGLGTWKGSRIKLDYVTANSDTSAVKLGTPSNEQNLRVYDDKVQVLDVPLYVKTLKGFADGYGASYTGAYEEPDHIATKKDVEAALGGGGGGDLSGLVQKSGDTMTGTLEVPRINVKKDGEAVSLIEGNVSNTNTAARLTFSNKYNSSAYASLEWHGSSGSNGWFQFTQSVDFNTKGLHSVNNIRLVGNKAIQEAQTTRIQLDGKVIIKKAGTNRAGFVLRGGVDGNSDGNLLSVYHNSSGLDSVDYYGKQEGVNNVATVGYVNSKAKAPLVSHMERLYHKANQTDGKSFYFQNQYSAPTTSMNDFRKFRWKLPSSHYLQGMAGAGRDMGYIVVCNTGGSLLYQCQVSNAQKDGLYITLDLDHDNHYGTSILGDAGWYVVHLFSCLREG